MAGTVRFTGAVPSGDSKVSKDAPDKTMNAVSIEVQGGKVITLMPFASVSVSEGQTVSEGQVLGTLAAAGDVSSAGTHVHMGYRSGSAYLDPMLLFGAAAKGASESDGQPSVSFGADASAANAANTGVEPSIATEGPLSDAAIEQAAPIEQPIAGGVVQDEPSPAFNSIETGEYDLKASHSAAASPFEALTGLAAQLRDACSEQLVCFTDALSALSKGTGIPLPVLFAAIPVLAASAAVALGFIAIRFLLPRFGSRILASRAAATSAATEKYLACH